MTLPNTPNTLTAQDVADRLGVCLKTAYNILNSGAFRLVRIPGVRALRVDEDDFNRTVEGWKCRPSSTRKASTNLSLAKGDAEFIAFCQKGRRTGKQSKKKPSCDVKYLIPTS